MKTKSKESDEDIRGTLEEIIEQVMDAGLFWPEVSAEIERIFILKALTRSNGFINKAAHLMGVHRNTLSARIREYNIDCRFFRHGKQE